jgi:hypothetical protein
MASKGVIYFIYGLTQKKFNHILNNDYKLAIRSATSLKQHMPDIQTTLFSNFNIPNQDPVFDRIITRESKEDIGAKGREDMWIYKYKCLLLSEYDYTLHMDADTYVCDPFPEIFEVLQKFDLALTLSMHYKSRKVDVPDCFPELAGGFMAWKKSKTMDQLFEKIISARTVRSRGSDEPYLRWALYHSDVRFSILPWEYNCLYIHPGYLFGKVKIMHGRRETIAEDAKIINTN